jgi:hypothetical protein
MACRARASEATSSNNEIASVKHNPIRYGYVRSFCFKNCSSPVHSKKKMKYTLYDSRPLRGLNQYVVDTGQKVKL